MKSPECSDPKCDNGWLPTAGGFKKCPTCKADNDWINSRHRTLMEDGVPLDAAIEQVDRELTERRRK